MRPAEKIVKVSPKGQITLPRGLREKLHSDVVRLVADEEAIRIEPVRELAASLSQYATSSLTAEEAREAAWTEAVREKHPRR